MDELKPCPFCGGNDVFIVEGETQDGNPVFDVGCFNPECPIHPCSWYFMTREDAVEAWNERVDSHE